MTAETTLARAAAADVAAGRLPVARQRLRGLVSSCPTQLPARRRLGEIYRCYGEPAQAGRWTYLEADRDPGETAAFEERYAHPYLRMRAVAWRGSEDDAATAFAREQLAGLRAAATEAAGRSTGGPWTATRTAAGRGPPTGRPTARTSCSRSAAGRWPCCCSSSS
ncbi:DUF6584 family protein [Kitasatospora sp. NPDC054939]